MITHPDDLDFCVSTYQKLLLGEVDSYQVEKRYIHKSGKVLSGILSVAVVREESGNPSFYISQVVDITEQKTKEEELKEIKDLHHQLISEHSQDIIMRNSPDWRISYVSPAIRNELGYEPEELIGTYWYDYWHPEDFDGWLLQDHSDNRIVEYRVRHKNGQYIWIESHSKKIRNTTGEFQHVLGICRNITKRKNMELKLKEIEQRHMSLLKYSPIGICALNLDRVFVEVNPAFEKMTGYTFSELCSMSVLDLAPKDLISSGKGAFQNSLNQEITNLDLVIVQKNGNCLDVVASSSPMMINEKIVGVYIFNRDVTEQKKTERHIQHTEKLSLVGELAAGIAHEIRNPLTSIRGFIQLLQTDEQYGAKKFYHDLMLSEIDRINEIVSELLVLAKPANETYGLGDITDKLDHVVTLIEGQAHLYNVQILKELDVDLPLIRCQSSLKQVFINILKNAIESMPNGGEVYILANRMDNKVCIRIIDQGCGIPQDQLGKICQPFFTTKEKGTGLGLMISQRIIQNHKGIMQIESEVGKGTTVEILLPVD